MREQSFTLCSKLERRNRRAKFFFRINLFCLYAKIKEEVENAEAVASVRADWLFI